MAFDYLEIGPVPAEEDCEQCGTEDYNPGKAKAECNRFIAAIRKVVGNEPDGATLIVKPNQHDFGTYYEVNVKYEIGNSKAMNYAFEVESNAPVTWPEGV